MNRDSESGLAPPGDARQPESSGHLLRGFRSFPRRTTPSVRKEQQQTRASHLAFAKGDSVRPMQRGLLAVSGHHVRDTSFFLIMIIDLEPAGAVVPAVTIEDVPV